MASLTLILYVYLLPCRVFCASVNPLELQTPFLGTVLLVTQQPAVDSSIVPRILYFVIFFHCGCFNLIINELKWRHLPVAALKS